MKLVILVLIGLFVTPFAATAQPAVVLVKHAIAAAPDESYREAGNTTNFDPISVCYGGSCAAAYSDAGILPSYSNLLPSVSSNTSFEGTDGHQINTVTTTSAWSDLKYYFTIFGSESIAVPLIVSGSAQLTFDGDSWNNLSSGSQAIARIVIRDSNEKLVSIDAFQCQSDYTVNCGLNLFQRQITSISFDSETGSFSGSIDLSAISTSHASFSANSASAFIDPKISIDPSFLVEHPEYSISVTQGIGNGISIAVPEPGIPALLFTGLGSLIWIHRRRARFPIERR